MFRRIVLSAALSGLVVGLLITVVQQFTVIPMILEAETYEVGAPAATEAAEQPGHSHQGHSHGHVAGEAEWAPDDGMERTFYTALTNTLAAIGFGLLLIAGFAVFGHADWRRGLLWGLGGFAVFHLAPAFGLPPELPGAAAAELSLRQVWWVSTVAATAAGLGVLVFAKPPLVRALGVVLIALPHLIGAPHPEVVGTSAVPAELASAFAIKTLVVGCIFWVMLGGLTGFTFNKIK